MRFALVGDDPDGLETARALAASGRHDLIAYADAPAAEVADWAPGARRAAELEDVLADPAVEAVVVAGRPDVRPAQLRRALQSERHVLCVHPPDHTPDIAYEAAMIRQDTGCALLPLLPDALHPAVRRLAAFARPDADAKADPADGPVGAFRLLEVEWEFAGEALGSVTRPDRRPTFPVWGMVRAVGGEVAELTAFAAGEVPEPGDPVLIAGRFERGGLFRVTLLPRRPDGQLRIILYGDRGRVELSFPVGRAGPAFLDWRDDAGEMHEEAWDRWDPWPALVERFEAAVAGEPGVPTWQDAVRALELDDAARRSIERRRSSLLEYQEASEAVGFKGTMTLVGCGLIWAVLLLLVGAIWVPPLRWLIPVLIVAFLGLQLLRYVLPKQPPPADAREAGRTPADAAASPPRRGEIPTAVPGRSSTAVQSKERFRRPPT
jgi:predicted dehydrogenase